jgi:MFS family permease
MTVPPIPDTHSLDLLFDYTKFHIGAYLTLAGSFITVASIKKGDDFALQVHRRLAFAAMIFFMVAGLAGGVIVSTITQCYGDTCKTTSKLLEMPIGPWNGKVIVASGQMWVYIEHTSFWCGLVLAVLAFLYVRAPSKASKPGSPKEPLAVVVQGTINLNNVPPKDT